jgi:hypothetical protein
MLVQECALVVLGGKRPAYANATSHTRQRHVLRVVLAFAPHVNLYSHRQTHNASSSRPNSASMVRVEDEALPMAQEVACWYVAALILLS